MSADQSYAYDAGYADAGNAFRRWTPGAHGGDCDCPPCGVAARAVAHMSSAPDNAAWQERISGVRRSCEYAFAATGDLGVSVYDAVWEIAHAAVDAAVGQAAGHPDGNDSETAIYAAVSAAIAAAGDYDADDAGLAMRAAFD